MASRTIADQLVVNPPDTLIALRTLTATCDTCTLTPVETNPAALHDSSTSSLCLSR